MKKVGIDIQKCKSCGLCIDVCPKNILTYSGKLNEAGYNHIECTDDDMCIVCKSCAIVCPDLVFTLNKISREGVRNG